MTQIILLEGISSSGKSKIQNLLKEFFEKNNKPTLIVDEKESINSLLNDKTRNLKTSIKVLKNLISKNKKLNFDYIIFDRFHISHNGTLKESEFRDFNEIEKLLLESESKIIYFHVNKNKIIERIRKCLKYRKNTGFEKYFKENIISGCKNKKEENKKIYKNYESRITQHLKDIKETKLKVLKINVSNSFSEKDYKKILIKVTKFIEQ